MVTNFYFDAFNLYYGCLKGTPHRWLDVQTFCELSFPQAQVHRIRYFTALVKARPNDPLQPVRQQVYLRALRTRPKVSVHLGRYLEQVVRMPLVAPPPAGPKTVQVIKSEEKGSDVNLASYLLLDAFDNDYEQAVIVSNDSDLKVPVELVRQRFGKPVVVLFPCSGKRRPSYDLSRVATSSPIVSVAHLAAAQFPANLTDANGPFHKPPAW